MDKGVPDLPYVLRPRGLRTGLTALLSAVAVFVVPAAAQAACQSTPTTKAFQAFGDSNDYSLVPNGGFESGAGGWSLSGARVAAGNESWSVRGAERLEVAGHRRGRHRRLADGVRRPQPPDLPLLRAAHQRELGRAQPCSVRWQDHVGTHQRDRRRPLDAPSAPPGRPSPRSTSPGLLPLWNDDQDYSVQLVFDPENYGGSWAIDDVYVDPYGRG